MSKREIIRCLKRYVAREFYRVLVPAASPPPIASCTSPSSPWPASLDYRGVATPPARPTARTYWMPRIDDLRPLDEHRSVEVCSAKLLFS